MYEDIKALARRSYRMQKTGSRRNYMKLAILRKQKRTMLVFHAKPPSHVRKYIRSCNYSWSRKYGNWHAYLSKDKARQIRKIYQLINN